jgi:peptidyl-prolyl cis-trans isomerase D
MLKMLRGGQRWLTALFIFAIGGVFVFFLGLGGPLSGPAPGAVVEVGPYVFGIPEFERVRARREAAIQAELGDNFDARALSETIDGLAARELVDEALLSLAASDLGLTVSKQEIERMVLEDPGFRDESGRFDKELFDRFTQYEYGSQHAFLEERRRSLLALKMLRLLNEQPEVSDGEIRSAIRRELEEVKIAFVSLDTATPSEEVEIAEEDVQAVLASRQEDLKALYEEQEALYNAKEQVRARHLLRTVARDADEAEVERVRGEAAAALLRIQNGEDFADVARELSQDPGSAEKGGDLGFFGRGQMAPAFEDAVFALQPGEMTDLVRTDYGFHIIRLEERKEAVERPFEEVQEELARELLRREAGNEQAEEDAEALAAAIRDGASLEDAAREAELDIVRSGWLTRRPDGYVPGLGPAPDLLARAFALPVGESSPEIFEVGTRLALVQVLERSEPEADEIEPRIEATRERLLVAKRNTRSADWINDRRQQLIEAGELSVNLDLVRR